LQQSRAEKARIRRIVEEVIDPMQVVKSVENSESGAIVLFLGTVRRELQARVESIYYECYGAMAEKKMEEIESELQRGWSVKRARVVHRVGNVRSGEFSVAVAVASTHRAEAFEACRHAMERIKHEVPIWKKERTSDGKELWVEGEPITSQHDDAKIKRVRRIS
jgi:molybdopterin synthase catalytic subunit